MESWWTVFLDSSPCSEWRKVYLIETKSLAMTVKRNLEADAKRGEMYHIIFQKAKSLSESVDISSWISRRRKIFSKIKKSFLIGYRNDSYRVFRFSIWHKSLLLQLRFEHFLVWILYGILLNAHYSLVVSSNLLEFLSIFPLLRGKFCLLFLFPFFSILNCFCFIIFSFCIVVYWVISIFCFLITYFLVNVCDVARRGVIFARSARNLCMRTQKFVPFAIKIQKILGHVFLVGEMT